MWPQYYLGGMESTAESYSGTNSRCKRGLCWAKPSHLTIWPQLLRPLLLAPLILPSAVATGAASWFSLKGPSPGRGPLSRTPLFLALYSQAWQPSLPAGFSSKVSPCEKPPLPAPGQQCCWPARGACSVFPSPCFSHTIIISYLTFVSTIRQPLEAGTLLVCGQLDPQCLGTGVWRDRRGKAGVPAPSATAEERMLLNCGAGEDS